MCCLLYVAAVVCVVVMVGLVLLADGMLLVKSFLSKSDSTYMELEYHRQRAEVHCICKRLYKVKQHFFRAKKVVQ